MVFPLSWSRNQTGKQQQHQEGRIFFLFRFFVVKTQQFSSLKSWSLTAGAEFTFSNKTSVILQNLTPGNPQARRQAFILKCLFFKNIIKERYYLGR